MSTLTIDPRNIISSEDFSKEYLKDSKSWQTAYSKLPSSGDYTKPNDKEKLILLSHTMNGKFKETLSDVFDKTDAGTARSTEIDKRFREYDITFEEAPQDIQPAPAITEKTVVKKETGTREVKLLRREIRSALYQLIGKSGSSLATVSEAATEHFESHLKDVADMVSSVSQVSKNRDQLVEFTVRSVFGKILGFKQKTDDVLPGILAGSPILIMRYEKILHAGQEAGKDLNIAFEEKVIDAAATQLVTMFEEPLGEVIALLKPLYAEALQEINEEFFGEK